MAAVGGGTSARAPTHARLVAALVLVQVLFGGMGVAGKLILPHIPAFGLALARLFTAAVVLFALERMFIRSPMPSRRDLAAFALFALLGVVLNQGLFLLGLAHTTATNAVLLISTIPVFTLLVAVVLRQEKATLRQGGGLALSFAGIALLVAGGLVLGRETFVGNLLVLANALSYSTYLVISRPTLARHDPLTVISWIFVFGVVQMAPLGLPQLLQVDWSVIPQATWIAFTYMLLGATVVTYGVNNWVLRYAPASKVASFVYLQPLVGVALAWSILAEPLTLRIVAAGALILAGVALANTKSRRAGRPF